MKFPKLKNKKVMIILFFVGILLLYLLYRKWKKNKITEKFEERDICISDKDDIKTFLQELSWNENLDDIKDLFEFPSGKNNINLLFRDSLIEKTTYFYDSINLQLLESYNDKQTDINYFPLSPTGIIFDTQNDDIIIFDIYRLRRFQYRLNRNDFTNENLTKENFYINNNFNDEKQIGKPKNIEVLSTFENNRNLFFIYLLIYVFNPETKSPSYKERVKILSYKINNPNPNPNYLVLEDSFKDLGKSTDEELLAIYENIEFQENNTNKIKVKFTSLKLIVDVDIIEKVTGQEGKLNMTVQELVTEIKKLKNEMDKYYEFKKCRNNTLLGNDDDRKNICKIKYQDDLPKYNLGEQGKGIESLNYDLADPNGEEIDTNYRKRAPLFNNKINPMSNSWNEPQYNGKFQPIISYRDKRTLIEKDTQHTDAITNDEKFNNEGMEGLNLKFDKNMLKEEFTNYEPNNVTISLGTKTKGYFIIPDELDSVGVKMCIEERIIFVPDTMNNRIQVFDIRKGGDFDYNNQFGNLDFTTYRSLPTYQGEEVTEGIIPLRNTSVMYEPIHNTEIFDEHLLSESPARCKTICNYDNGNYIGPKHLFDNEPQNRSECYAELKKRLQSEGPQVLRQTENSTRSQNIDEYYTDKDRELIELSKKYNYLGCEANFSVRRANIHNKQIEEGNKYIKKGHFYSLFNEYERVKMYLKKDDLKVATYLNEYNLVDGAEVCIGKFDNKNCRKAKDPYDGVKGCSLAYRKFLLKIIYETNNGQKYGQLFRPKSITYDKNGDCFYVVDTYHHCIQCFIYNKETNEYVSKDKSLNDRAYFCYDKDWNYNLDYHISPVYSLGLRQQVIQKTSFERKEDIDRQKGEFSNPEGLKGDFSTPESKISDEWCEKYSEPTGEVKLYRWVSGSTKYGNKSFGGNIPNYGSIGREENQERINHDYFFYTNLVVKNKKQTTNEKEAIDFPGVGEFLYPSDIIFIDRYYSAINVDLLMVADTGNNRVSIFKKYNLSKSSDDHRFRFYRFLGDKDTNMLENPIGITFSKVNGYVYVLEGNMFNYDNNSYKNDQKIKIFKPKKNKEEVEYNYSKTIDLNDIDVGKRQKDIRITKIEVDDRGFILLTDINNNKVHILKEQIEDSLEFDKSDSRVLNKVKFTLVDNQKTKVNDDTNNNIRSYNRFRILVHRWNISKQEDNILMSKEFVYDYFKNKDKEAKDKFFTFEDKYEEDLYRDGYWEMNKEDGEPYIIDAQKLKGLIKKTPDTPLEIKDIQYLDVNKRIGNKESINYGIEDWKGKPLKPNSSYVYRLYQFNYTNLQEIISENFEPVVHIPPLGIPSDKILFQNNVSNNQNTIKIVVDYDSISKLHKETSIYNPLCLYILRRNHNRTRQGLLRYLNLYRHNMIQLFVPIKSKYIFNIHSKPKFGKLYILNLNEEGDPLEMRNDKDKYLLEPTGEDKLKYMDSNYIIFYSAEGGNLDQNGNILPTSEQLGMDTIDDFFTLGDDPNDPHTKIKYHVKIDISQTRDNAIILDDNTKIENMLLHYRKDRMKRDETQLELVMKEPIAKKINGKFRNSIVRYNDSGIVKDGEKIPLPLNRTIEYNILVGNPHKLNPGCNSKFFTTRPEKPYIKDISIVTVTQGNEKKSKIKIEWYYTQNMNLYWPVNFLILRIPKADSGPGIKPYELVLDYTKGSKNSTDINFTIQKNQVIVKMGGKHTFEKSYDLNGKKTYKVKFPPFDKLEKPKELTINGEKFVWTSENRYHIFEGDRITIKIELDGNENVYLGTAVVEEYTDENDNNLEITPGPEISNPETVNTPELQNLRVEQLKNYKKEQSEQFNQNLIRAVEAYRQANRIGFYFNLQDDYNGRYRSVTDNYSGKSGQLYYYLNSLEIQQLYNILNELHDKIKIYHGEATMGIDGPNGMLRSGGKDTIIEKIRHLSFELRQATLMENKALGITCQNRDLNDIIQEEGLQGSIQCMQTEMKDKNDLIDKLNENFKNEENLDIVKLVDEYNITYQPEIEQKSSAPDLVSFNKLNDLLLQFKDLDSQVLLVDIVNRKYIFSNIPVEMADKDITKENLMLFEKKVEGFTGKYNIEKFSVESNKKYLILNAKNNNKFEPIILEENIEFPKDLISIKNLDSKYHKQIDFKEEGYKEYEFNFGSHNYKYLTKIYFMYFDPSRDKGKFMIIRQIELNGIENWESRKYKRIFDINGDIQSEIELNNLFDGGTYLFNVNQEIGQTNKLKIRVFGKDWDGGSTCKLGICLLLEKDIRKNYFYEKNLTTLMEYSNREIISLAKDIEKCGNGETKNFPSHFEKWDQKIHQTTKNINETMDSIFYSISSEFLKKEFFFSKPKLSKIYIITTNKKCSQDKVYFKNLTFRRTFTDSGKKKVYFKLNNKIIKNIDLKKFENDGYTTKDQNLLKPNYLTNSKIYYLELPLPIELNIEEDYKLYLNIYTPNTNEAFGFGFEFIENLNENKYYLSQNVNLEKNISNLKTINNTLESCFKECYSMENCDIIRTINSQKNEINSCELMEFKGPLDYSNISKYQNYDLYQKKNIGIDDNQEQLSLNLSRKLDNIIQSNSNITKNTIVHIRDKLLKEGLETINGHNENKEFTTKVNLKNINENYYINKIIFTPYADFFDLIGYYINNISFTLNEKTEKTEETLLEYTKDGSRDNKYDMFQMGMGSQNTGEDNYFNLKNNKLINQNKEYELNIKGIYSKGTKFSLSLLVENEFNFNNLESNFDKNPDLKNKYNFYSNKKYESTTFTTSSSKINTIFTLTDIEILNFYRNKNLQGFVDSSERKYNNQMGNKIDANGHFIMELKEEPESRTLFNLKAFQNLEDFSIENNNGTELIQIGNNEYYIFYDNSVKSGSSQETTSFKSIFNDTNSENSLCDDTTTIISYDIFDNKFIKKEIEIKSEEDITINLESDKKSILFIKKSKINIEEKSNEINNLESTIQNLTNGIKERSNNKEKYINNLKDLENKDERLMLLLKRLQALYSNNISVDLLNNIKNLEKEIMDLINLIKPSENRFNNINNISGNIKDNQVSIYDNDIQILKLSICLKKKYIIENLNLAQFTGKYLIEGFENEGMNNETIDNLEKRLNQLESEKNKLDIPIKKTEKPDYIYRGELISTSEKEKTEFLNKIMNCSQNTNNNTNNYKKFEGYVGGSHSPDSNTPRISRISETSLEECKKKCSEDPNCKLINYSDGSDGTCDIFGETTLTEDSNLENNISVKKKQTWDIFLKLDEKKNCNNLIDTISEKIDIENDLSVIDSSSKEIKTTNYKLYIERFVNDEMPGISNIIIDLVKKTVILVRKIITVGEKNNIEKIGSTCIWKKGEKRFFARKVKNYQIINGNLTKPVFQIENNKLSESNNQTILENYAIQPTLSSLAAEKDISADKLFNDDTNDKNHMYTLHTHYIDLDPKDKKEYGYKIGCYQVGHNLNNTQKRKFLGIVRDRPESELGYGEVYSDMRFLGQGGELEQEKNEPISFLSEIPKQAEKVVEPVIKYFEPKEGNEHTVVRIVGNGLDKLEYICFRDIKVKILKKQKRIINENGEKVSYQEYIVKPPTLKELDRECWQSYEPYKVLVWGYFKGTGKQIRSSETQNPESKMYKYMVRSNCPESNKAMRKYKKDIVPSMSN